MYEYEKKEKTNEVAHTLASARFLEAWSHKFWGISVTLFLVDWFFHKAVTNCSLVGVFALAGLLGCTQLAIKKYRHVDTIIKELSPSQEKEE